MISSAFDIIINILMIQSEQESFGKLSSYNNFSTAKICCQGCLRDV